MAYTKAAITSFSQEMELERKNTRKAQQKKNEIIKKK